MMRYLSPKELADWKKTSTTPVEKLADAINNLADALRDRPSG